MTFLKEGPSIDNEADQRAEADVHFMKNSILKEPQGLRETILFAHEYHLLVSDALEEIDYFCDGSILPKDDAIYPLVAALPLPSERNVDANTTIIRLLHPMFDQFEGFKVDAYGKDVTAGVRALRREPGQTFGEYLDKVDRADKAIPYLGIADTLGKQMLLGTLTPVRLPLNLDGKQLIQARYEGLFAEYAESFEKFFNQPGREKWPLRITKGMEIGRKALNDLSK